MSAESRLAARLKLVRVRVEFSKNKLKTIRPWRAGTFLRLAFEISENDSAVSRIARISSRRQILEAEQVLAAPARRAGTEAGGRDGAHGWASHRSAMAWGRLRASTI